MRLFRLLGLASLALRRGCIASGLAVPGRPSDLILDEGLGKRAPLQNVVTWDDKSFFIHGKRAMIFSGEFHPFRLPVPSLWLDVFQKVKALGLNTVSFSLHWGLLEGKPGQFSAEGVFDLETFFKAASDARVFLIAKPGPYIRAGVSGGGLPGWLRRKLRTNGTDHVAATENYVSHVGRIIAKHQITNGGPVILLQPETSRSEGTDGTADPKARYTQLLIEQYRKAGVVIPVTGSYSVQGDQNAPEVGAGAVDVYGKSVSPSGFDCASPERWPAGGLDDTLRDAHSEAGLKTPLSLLDVQGGSSDKPGGPGYERCAELFNHEFERVLYKNSYGAGAALMNIYTIFGGTNWGNLGGAGGYTSYDYGAAITEDRTVTREKYAELKLQAQFLRVSPGYSTADGGTNTTNFYNANPSITTTPVLGANGSFFVVRHLQYGREDTSNYTLNLPTSLDWQVLPKGGIGGSLSLHRRESKIHVTDYPVGDAATLLYCTAEIFTWLKAGDRTHLVVYTGPEEVGELAVSGFTNATILEGSGLDFSDFGDFFVAEWVTSTERRVIQIGNLVVYIVDRNSAYNYWVPEVGNSSVIIKNGYLIRSASISGNTLHVKADFNSSTELEIIGVPTGVQKLQLNGQERLHRTTSSGSWVAIFPVPQMRLAVPDLSQLAWKYVDSLPELQASYDDSRWTQADHATTPTSLYASDYGFHAGAIVFRGTFNATGREMQLRIHTQGGPAFASSVWLGSTFVGSWAGDARTADHEATYRLPSSLASGSHTLTVVVDNMGLDQNPFDGADAMKSARGILSYALDGPDGTNTTTPIKWKIAGNLGGEDYVDKARGPLNEGGFFAERMGLHLPSPQLDRFASGSPLGINGTAALPAAGARFFAAKLPLSLPSPRFDIPVAFAFENQTASAVVASGPFRALLFVNGFQFGRYISNIGPQTRFPVPEGVLDYGGDNWIGLLVWALEERGATVPGFYLDVRTPVLTGREPVTLVDAPAWTARPGAF